MIQNKTHEQLLKSIIKALCVGSKRLFKYNSGQGWTGNKTVRGPLNGVHLGPNDVLIRNARILRGGITGIDGKPITGVPDIAGFETVTITPDMVGQRVAVLLMIEVKTGKGVLSKDQKRFHEFANNAGIRIGVARGVDDAKHI